MGELTPTGFRKTGSLIYNHAHMTINCTLKNKGSYRLQHLNFINWNIQQFSEFSQVFSILWKNMHSWILLRSRKLRLQARLQRIDMRYRFCFDFKWCSWVMTYISFSWHKISSRSYYSIRKTFLQGVRKIYFMYYAV